MDVTVFESASACVCTLRMEGASNTESHKSRLSMTSDFPVHNVKTVLCSLHAVDEM